MKILLSNMKKGQSGIVENIDFNDEENKRKMHLLEMGFSIELRGYELCISKKDASRIIVSRSINV